MGDEVRIASGDCRVWVARNVGYAGRPMLVFREEDADFYGRDEALEVVGGMSDVGDGDWRLVDKGVLHETERE